MCLNVHLAGCPRDARLKPLLLLGTFLFSCSFPILPKHLRKGTWTGRTVTINGSLLMVVGAKLRIPLWLYRPGSLTSTPNSRRLCYTTCNTG